MSSSMLLSHQRRTGTAVFLCLLCWLPHTAAVAVPPFVECPRGVGELDFAGPVPVETAVRVFSDQFEAACPDFTVDILLGGDSAAAARQVCSQFLQDTEQRVELGGMTRDWDPNIDDFDVEEDGFTIDCGGSTREAVQLLVGYDAAVVGVLAGSPVHACLASMPQAVARGGRPSLTVDQLRWMFSSYSDDELAATGWDPASVPGSLNTENRTWAELGGPDCPDVTIYLTGPDEELACCWDLFLLFAEEIFVGEDEFFHEPRYDGEDGGEGDVEDELTDADELDGLGIGLISLNFILSRDLTLVPVDIRNPQTNEYVTPSYETVSSAVYSPLSQPLYLNVLRNDRVFDRVNALLEAGFSPMGDAGLEAIGKIPLSDGDKYAARIKVGSPFAPTASEIACGENMGMLQLAGSSSIAFLAEIWAQVYRTHCGTEQEINIDVTGSFEAAAAICQPSTNATEGEQVHIAMMSREFQQSEATSSNSWLYQCTGSSREVIEVNVAIDGQVFMVNDMGPAFECIQSLGGLTRDQLRWMFSNLSEEELATEIDLGAAIPNSDNNATTHLWSELSMDPVCVDEEIKLAGADLRIGSVHSTSEYLFSKEGETFDYERFTAATGISYESSTSDNTVVNFVLDREDAIGLLHYSNYTERGYDAYLIPVFNPNLGAIGEGKFVQPDLDTLESFEYPLVRRSRMALLNEPSSLEVILPFIQFVLSPAGQRLVGQSYHSQLSATEATIMQTRAQTDLGVSFADIREASHLGCASEGFSIAGSSTVFPIAELWSGVYEVGCGIEISVQGGGSSSGAGRVCGEASRGTPVDIGNMSREWRAGEALARADNPRIYECQKGDTARSAIQARVAIDGITVTTLLGGIAAECIDILGGLTIDQLRWIYSDRSDEELLEDPDWDPNSVPNPDGSALTHLWSELHEDCARQEIQISGPDEQSGTYEYMLQTIFPDYEEGETFDLERPAPYVNNEVDEVLVQYLEENPSAISFFGYAYFFTRQNVLAPVSIRNRDGDFILASPETLADNSYNPLSRPIYMNLLNEPEVLANTFPFIQFGFSNKGSELVDATGYVAVDSQSKFEILNALASAAGLPPPPDVTAPPTSSPTAAPESGNDGGLSGGAIAGICIGGGFVCLLCIVGVVLMKSGIDADEGQLPYEEETVKEEKNVQSEDQIKKAEAAAVRGAEVAAKEEAAKKERQVAAKLAQEEAAAAQRTEAEKSKGAEEAAAAQRAEAEQKRAEEAGLPRTKADEGHITAAAPVEEKSEGPAQIGFPDELVPDELIPDEY